MPKLTNLEYSLAIQAIQNALAEIADDTFIDPYNNEQNITNDQAKAALLSVENKLHKAHVSK